MAVSCWLAANISSRRRKSTVACLVTAEQVEHAIRHVLGRDGFTLTLPRKNGETGVDILASNGSDTWHIETIGYKSSPPARSTDFYQVFFRAISRLKDGATLLAIALPAEFGRGLHQRASHYGEAWDRLGAAFPEIEIWLVSSDPPAIQRSMWADWH